ncbi:tetratricopeptide repeat protein [bacterium]|nr:MAG: tetratricopeptide repeat protein [bacterium]
MRALRPALPLTLVLAAGCFATQRDILDLSQQNDTIQLQVQSMKKVMTQIQSNQADLNSRLEDLHKDMTVLNESLKDSRDSTGRLSAKMDDLGAAIGVKVTTLQKGITDTQQQLREAEERRKAESAEAERRAAAEEARKKAEDEAREKAAAEAAAAKSAAKPAEVYKDAKAALDKKQYDEAARGFEQYLDRFPKGESADLAGYHLGQARYAVERWEDAARAYAVVLDRFPKSEVTAGSRLRYAQCLLKLKTHVDEAKKYLESIPHDFPKSSEAAKARELLQSLNGKKG